MRHFHITTVLTYSRVVSLLGSQCCVLRYAAAPLTPKTYHTQRISCGIVKAEAEALLAGIRVVKGRACDRAGGDRAADPPPLARA